ncbi:MAG TPA: type II toxin-antitoxin system RelE/ParE family toxin [Gemmata sp.]|jgi:plasmid stabilization system protein ParE|nr:type II toxin-antitoxin system RelE/ParE family toxin [Gemmata sp.]
MSLPIAFIPEAREEFDSAVEWYENRADGLGRALRREINKVLERIATNPRVHAIVYQDVRKAVVRRFPYCVFYREDAGKLAVLSVFHTSRDPAEWYRRVKNPNGN